MGRVTSRQLLAAADDLPPHEAIRIAMAATGRARAEIVADCELSDAEAALIEELLGRRRAGQPLQYLEGAIPFGPAEIAVDERALIPRPETEYLYELASAATAEPHVIVDIGTGSGCLAIALKRTFPAARVIGTDVSPLALSLAHENAERNSVDVEFHVGDLFGALPRDLAGAVDLLVSNPPYISDEEMEALPSDVAEWEPQLALRGGPDGLSLVRPLIDGLPTWLASEGIAYIEVGAAHADAAVAVAVPVAERAEVVADLAGRPRFVKVSFDSRRFGVAGEDRAG